RMSFSAISRFPASTACQASSANLRALRRSFSFSFFALINAFRNYAYRTGAARGPKPIWSECGTLNEEHLIYNETLEETKGRRTCAPMWRTEDADGTG